MFIAQFSWQLPRPVYSKQYQEGLLQDDLMRWYVLNSISTLISPVLRRIIVQDHYLRDGTCRGKPRIYLCNVHTVAKSRRFPEPWLARHGPPPRFGLVGMAGNGARNDMTVVRVTRDHAVIKTCVLKEFIWPTKWCRCISMIQLTGIRRCSRLRVFEVPAIDQQRLRLTGG